MELLVTKLIGILAVPPGLFFSLIILGIIVRIRFVRTGQLFFYSGLVSLVIVSMPIVSAALVNQAQTKSAITTEQLKTHKAKLIIVLGGGRYADAPEYQLQDTVSRHTLERCRYASHLQRQLKLPILVTGGSVYGGRKPEADLMKQVIEEDFNGTVQWTEDKSRTTYENALLSYQMLRESGNTNIILVTHALHMPRSQEAFEKAGFTVTPAPLGFYSKDTRPFHVRILPSIGAANISSQVFHEWVGRLWYTLRYY